MNKQEAINCNDGQKLADAVAVECMGWIKRTYPHGASIYMDKDTFAGDTAFDYVDWQPHLPTEKGKAQCWDLMHKCNMHVDCDEGLTTVFKHFMFSDLIKVEDKNTQIAILKACLLSQLGEGDA